MHDRRQRRDRQRRYLLPDYGQEASARPGDRAAEPAAVHLPRRLRRRVPAAPGRGLPRPRALRPHLLQPGDDERRGHSADRRGARLVHRGRRLRSRDERRGRHRAQPGHDLPRRPAAGEGRDRRGGDRRGARRRRPALEDLRRHRPPGRTTTATRCGSCDASSSTLGPRSDAAVGRRADRRRGGRPDRALRRRARRRAGALRRARGDHPHRRRRRVRRVQGRVRHDAGHRLRPHPRPSGRHHRQQRRAVRRIGAEGCAFHRAVRQADGAAAVPAEHLRLHGRPRLRGRRHRQARRQDGHRRRVRAGARSSPS